MKIELMQLAGRDGDTAYNLARALAAITNCNADTDLLVFPETHLMGFVSDEQLANVAEPLDGPTLRAVQQAVRERDVSVVIGLVECDASAYYNTSVLITPTASPCAIAKPICGPPSAPTSRQAIALSPRCGTACVSAC